MRIRAFVFLMMSALASVCFAQQVSEEQAYQTAMQFLAGGQSAQKAPARNSEQPLTLTYKAQTNKDNDLYVFNREGGGFVIVSADARTVKPVLGYSDNGSFDASNMPPQLQDILSLYQKEINYARENLAPQEVLPQESSRERKVIVEPLIKTKWSQVEPYNGFCPMDGDSKSLAGCVACAMAQVMNYWRWPERGMGSHRDICADSLYIDFSQSVYDWDNMATTYTADTPQVKIDAVQRLMYDCGISVDTKYSKKASTTNSFVIPAALTCYFNYVQARFINRSDYETEWDSLMASELDAGRPILYSGEDSNAGGHELVCDGYDSEHYFHFNIGWNGDADGYYLTNAINIRDKYFNSSQRAIIGIYPDYEDHFCSDFLGCNIDEKGNAEMYTYVSMSDTFDLLIPDSILIDGAMYPIKSVKAKALREGGLKYCQNIITSETLDSIGYYAFRNNRISSVYISSSVRKIEWGAFGACNNLNTITVSESNPYYYSPQGSNVVIELSTGRLIWTCNYSVLPSEGIKIIGENSFEGLDSLTVIRLPESVEVIEDDAFAYCSNLKEVYFGTAVTYLGVRIFKYCSNLTDLYFYSATPPVIGPPTEKYGPNIPYGCTIHVKPSALESFKALEVLSSYTIVPDVPETTTATPSVRSDDDIEPQYYDLLGRPVQKDYKGLKISRNRKQM